MEVMHKPAIAYGICDDIARRNAILSHIETQMQDEAPLCWPINFYPYEKDEGHSSNFPFPKCESGDIFFPGASQG